MTVPVVTAGGTLMELNLCHYGDCCILTLVQCSTAGVLACNLAIIVVLFSGPWFTWKPQFLLVCPH